MAGRSDATESACLLTERKWSVRGHDQVEIVGGPSSEGRAFVWLGSRDVLDEPLGAIWEVTRESSSMFMTGVPRICALAVLEGSDVLGIASAMPLQRAFPSDARLELRKLERGPPGDLVATRDARSICRVDWRGGARSAWSSSSVSMVWLHDRDIVHELAPTTLPLSFHRPALALSSNGMHAAVSRRYPFVESYELSESSPRAYAVDTGSDSMLVDASTLSVEERRALDAQGFRADALCAVAVREPATSGRAGELWVQSIDVSSDGRRVILASDGLFAGEHAGDLVMCVDGERSLEFAAGGSIIASAAHAEGRKLAIVNAVEPDRVTILRFSGSHVSEEVLASERPTSLRWSIDGSLLAVASLSGAQIWRTLKQK